MNSPIAIWRDHKKLHNYLNKLGKLIVWTKVYVAPAGFEHQAPYIVGIVEFADKSRMPLEIVDCEEINLKSNLKLKVVIRRIGKASVDEVIRYGLKARPT